ncbi:chemotaxis signal transduction protein [Thermosporothrix hazakensis]|jgi:chemotaxis signal transduction protein|uniref:Chemotaxis signal transduction protein n=2 Tax=Thermosporothrix TaxID=768650 RepID=A0A326U2Q5_THEHA|nr:chemotaxis protein CheW [Thermosporothrix hazakensis]PZW22922.1 chemotaxis signal transduction protein [Thermosporothrix hazakensis]BBH89800.1 hypothetical protein KTC_45510 [Thermosporothrix sp. COM3]GCE47989.1 hypothetical protein KTH_28580 [Thermosporothrix hazakensis]
MESDSGIGPVRFYAHSLEHISDEEFWQLASEAAQSSPTAVPSAAQQYLLCTLRRGPCILPQQPVREVIFPLPACAQLPFSPPWLLGLISWHGETIPVVDLNMYLWRAPASGDARDGSLLVVQKDQLSVGFLVSTVVALTLDAQQILPAGADTPFNHLPPTALKMVRGVETLLEEQTLLLDIGALLPEIVQQLSGGMRDVEAL